MNPIDWKQQLAELGARRKKRPVFERVLFALGGLYLAVAIIIPLARSLYGLDESWRTAIGMAAHDRLVFGRDVMFTYGPLGYLLEANPASPMAAATAIAHVAFAFGLVAIAMLRARSFASPWLRVVFVVAMAMLAAGTGRVEYEVAAGFIIALTFPSIVDGSSRRGVAWLGIVVAASLMAKFSLGFATLGATMLLYAARALADPPARRQALSALVVLVSTVLVAGVAAFEAARIDVFAPFVVLAVAAAAAPLADRLDLRWIAALGAAALVAAVADPALRMYAVLSLEITAGYSDGEWRTGRPNDIFIALAEMAAVALGLAALWSRRSAGLVIALLYLEFTFFKHGFVRERGHWPILFVGIAAIAVAAAATAHFPAVRRRNAVAAVVAAAVAFGIAVAMIPRLQPFDAEFVLGTTAASWSLADAGRVPSAVGDTTADVLPPNVRAAIGSGSVDAMPWEAIVIRANALRWDPTPVFQTYQANTPRLDAYNADAVARHGADHIVFGWMDIDEHAQPLSAPRTFREVMCRYRPDGGAPFTVATLPAILLHRGADRCGAVSWGETRTYRTGTAIPVQPSQTGLTVASVRLHRTLLGAVQSVAYRGSELRMKLEYADGATADYRIVPSLIGEPFLISPFPRNLADVAALARDGSGPAVRAIRVITTPGRFAESMDVRIGSVPFTTNAAVLPRR